jgi:copper oxidase (laccase) domain-containing protein
MAHVCLTVLTADCAAVALGSPEGVHAAVHAGWRGLAAGVVERAVEVVRACGGSEVVAGLGPCIGPCCYEFSMAGVDAMAGRYGDGVRAVTNTGTPSLDLPEGVRVALHRAGVPVVVDLPACTACAPEYFSHRARGEAERQALLVWNGGAG